MGRQFVYLLFLLFSLSQPATGQANEARVCFTADVALASEIADYKSGQGTCTPGRHGCGSAGGPGYRSYVSGQCVGWSELNKTCGPPPHNDCFAECLSPAGSCALPDDLEVVLLDPANARRSPGDLADKPGRRPRVETGTPGRTDED